MEIAKSFQALKVWQKSHQLVPDVYKLSADFPKEEMFGLTSQIRRAVISVPANIAEGFKPKSKMNKSELKRLARLHLKKLTIL